MDEYQTFRKHIYGMIRLMDAALDTYSDAATVDERFEVVAEIRDHLQTKVTGAATKWQALKVKLDEIAARLGA